jgi:uncharacterized protein YndB with AHSA1/START domain
MPVTGRYQTVEDRPVVRFERTFPHPVKEVWEAITDPSRLAQWFPTTVDFAALAPGAPIRFECVRLELRAMSGEVRVVDPPRELVFTWGQDELSFELHSATGAPAAGFASPWCSTAPRRRRATRPARRCASTGWKWWPPGRRAPDPGTRPPTGGAATTRSTGGADCPRARPFPSRRRRRFGVVFVAPRAPPRALGDPAILTEVLNLYCI